VKSLEQYSIASGIFTRYEIQIRKKSYNSHLSLPLAGTDSGLYLLQLHTNRGDNNLERTKCRTISLE
jgi:hypothetical protein